MRQKRQAAESVALFDTGATGDSVAAARQFTYKPRAYNRRFTVFGVHLFFVFIVSISVTIQ